MTSAPQRTDLQPQGQTNATAAPSAAPSTASATEKSVAQPAVSETAHPGVSASDAAPAPQHGHSPPTSSVTGKPSMQQNSPPVAGGPTIVNGNTHGDHGRKPSVTISAAGATGYMPNGRPMSGPTARPDNLQFGSLDAQGSSASSSSSMPHADAQNQQQQQQQQQQNLGVAPSANNRVTSPDASPSPIPQPMVSGGRPPSSLQGQGNNLNFGPPPSGDQSDMNRSMRPIPQGPVASGPPQSNHFRRESTHSAHSDMGGHGPNVPGGPGRGGYGGHGGRNRSYGQPHHQSQMGYNPPGPYRSASNQHRGGPHMGHQYSQRSVGYPNPAARSPAMANVNPATPPGNPVPMANPQVQPQHYGPYPPHMGAQQGYMPPNYDYYYQSGAYQMPQMPYMAPSSPRPPFATGGPQPPYMQGQYNNQVLPNSQGAPLSREPSQVSDRPGSSLSQNQPPPAPTTQGHHAHHSSQPTHSPTPSQFSVPKKSGVSIRDPNGNPITFPKASASPARASPSPVKLNATPASTPTPPPPAPPPPPRAPSRGEQDQAENKSQSGEEKKQDFRDAIARAAESAKKEAEEKKASEPKQQNELEESDQKEGEEAKKEETAPAAPVDEKPVSKEPEAAAPTVEEESKAPEPAKSQEELDLDAIEREMAEKEAAEEEAERAYREKKRKEKEEADRKAKETADAYEANLKNAEREAEALEEERMRKREKEAEPSPGGDVFAALRAKEGQSPPSTEGAATRTPGESGAATPVSDTSMGPPQKPASAAAAKREKPAALKLETAKTAEPPQPSAAMKALQTARFLEDPTKVAYPSSVVPPNPALNANAPEDRKFKYNQEFLIQFQNVFKEKPSLDWDNRLKETVGDSSDSARPSPRVQSTGGRGGASARPAVPGGFPGATAPMGTFGQAHGKPQTVAAGSQDRFPVSIGRGTAMAGGPFGQIPRGVGMGSGMARTASAGPLQQPNSPRAGSHRGTRTGSKRDKSGKKEEEGNKTMPLTAGNSVEPLAISGSGWKPRSVGRSNLAGPAPGGDGHLPPEVVQGKVKSNLNKMTPEKFDRIADQILAIVAQSKDESDGRTLRQVIQLTFEKATDEAHWAPMYAKFCMRMLESMSPDIKDENIRDKQGNVVTGGSLFRKYLLNRCQEEFERGWKVNLPEKPDGVTEEAAMMSEEYYKAAAAKRRGLGLVKFIGELFKLGMLTERIMHECVKKMVDYDGTPDEAEIESLVSLLRTIGMALDSTDKGRSMMDAYFSRINMILESTEISSRHKFMLMDVIDLRKAQWVSKDTDKGPKTIVEIREAAARHQQEQEMEKMRQQASRGGGGGRMQMGRGDARNFSGYGNQPPPQDFASSKVGTDDLRRLKATRAANQPASQSLGPPSMFGSRSSSSGRRNQGPGGNLVRGGEDSGASSRTGTPPGAKDKKDDKDAASSTNAFSALAGLDAGEAVAGSPPTSQATPGIMKSQPAVTKPSDTNEGAGGST